MSVTVENTSVDCNDAKGVGEFWAAILDRPLQSEPEEPGFCWIEFGSKGPDLQFVTVPEAKQVKNRLHIDLRPDNQEAEVRRALSLGARHIDIGQGEQTWVVLADPEGNEFCILRALRPNEA